MSKNFWKMATIGLGGYVIGRLTPSKPRYASYHDGVISNLKRAINTKVNEKFKVYPYGNGHAYSYLHVTEAKTEEDQ